MLGNLFMRGTDDSTTSMALTKLPEFIPPEPTDEEKKEAVCAWDGHASFECTCKIAYMSARTRKWWACLSKYGNWTARGPIRMRMLKKAAMQEKQFIHKHHVWVDDENNLLWYRRGDGTLMKFRIIPKEEGA